MATAVRKCYGALNRDVKTWQRVEGACKLRGGGCRFSLFLRKQSSKTEVSGKGKSP